MNPETLKVFYNSVLAQTTSSCGQFLFVGTNFSDIFVYSIAQICVSPDDQQNGETTDETNNGTEIMHKNSLTKPIQVLTVTDGSGQRCQIQSFAFYNDVLIVGMSKGRVHAYSWYKNRLTKKLWHTFLTNQNIPDPNDINCFWMQSDGTLMVGCGDTNIYAISVDGGRMIRKFTGHSDYVHWIDGTPNSTKFYSASEDGSIKFWDSRVQYYSNDIEPHMDLRLDRPQFGKWLGTVSVTDDWLLCGGGPKPCLYHLRSLECSTIFDINAGVHVSGFLDDIIYLGGDDNNLYQYNYKGEVTAQIPSSSTSIYSVVTQNAPEKFMSIAGSCNYLDICTNFNYRDIVIKMYESKNHYMVV